MPADVSLGTRLSGGHSAGGLTASRVDSLYDLMDSAYDAPEIRAFSEQLRHVPIIDLNPRRRPQMKAERKREALVQRRIGHLSPEARRYRERSTVERVNGRLKDEFGGRHVGVRGPGKVWCTGCSASWR